MGAESVDIAGDARPGIGDRLAELIRVPTVSARRDDPALAQFTRFHALLAELYPRVHGALAVESFGDGLLYHWPGRASTKPIVLMAHQDVVPADEVDRWTHPPFSGEILDGTVWGRGAVDDKGELVVVLEAVENLLTAAFVPAQDVYIVAGGTEETAGDDAVRMAAALAERGVTPWLVLDEGGAVVDSPIAIAPIQAAMIGLGEKGITEVRLTAESDPGHASAPPASTAVGRIGRAVARLEQQPFPSRLTPAIRGMLTTLGRATGGGNGILLRLLAAVPALGACVLSRTSAEAAAMTHTTVAPTMLTAGSASNVLAGSAEATLNIRILPGETVDTVVARLIRVIDDPHVDVTVVEGDDPSPLSDADGPQFAAIAAALAAGYPDAVPTPYLMMQASDARHFHRRWPQVFRFAPLKMSTAQRAAIHGIDEHVHIDDLDRGERIIRALITALPD